MEAAVAETLLHWVYTDQVDLSGGDGHLLDLMHAASTFHLEDLVNKLVSLFLFLFWKPYIF